MLIQQAEQHIAVAAKNLIADQMANVIAKRASFGTPSETLEDILPTLREAGFGERSIKALAETALKKAAAISEGATHEINIGIP